MKTITKTISLIMLGGAFAGCTIVMPGAETASNKAAPSTETEKTAYQRPNPIPPSGISSKETESEEKIDYPSRNNNTIRAVSDTTKQRPKRRRR